VRCGLSATRGGRCVKKACGTPVRIGAVKGCRSEWKLGFERVRGASGGFSANSDHTPYIYYIGQSGAINRTRSQILIYSTPPSAPDHPADAAGDPSTYAAEASRTHFNGKPRSVQVPHTC